MPQLPSFDSMQNTGNPIKMNLHGGSCTINGKLVNQDKIKQVIKSLISENLDYQIFFDVDGNETFDNYFKVIESCRIAVEELRYEFSQEMYSLPYNALEADQAKEIMKLFGINLNENLEHL